MKMPAVMPAQSAIAGIAVGQRTTAGEQKFCPHATGYRLPARSYQLFSASSDFCVVILNGPHVERVRSHRANRLDRR